MNASDGKWLTTAGPVLVRQKLGSAKGVIFITTEDETWVANLVIWPSLYEGQRRIILASGNCCPLFSGWVDQRPAKVPQSNDIGADRKAGRVTTVTDKRLHIAVTGAAERDQISASFVTEALVGGVVHLEAADR